MGDTPGSQTVSTKLQRIAEQAKQYPAMVFNNLYHLIDRDFLMEAFRQTRKSGALGVDKITAGSTPLILKQTSKTFMSGYEITVMLRLPLNGYGLIRKMGRKDL